MLLCMDVVIRNMGFLNSEILQTIKMKFMLESKSIDARLYKVESKMFVEFVGYLTYLRSSNQIPTQVRFHEKKKHVENPRASPPLLDQNKKKESPVYN